MKQYLLGIDIGTSACKAAVFQPDGKVAAGGSGSYPVYYPHPGWAEQDPDEWWTAVCKTVREILERGKIRPEDIVGIGVDGQSWSAIPMDRDGNVLANTPIWMDTRAYAICSEVQGRIGEKAIFEVSGNPFQPSYTTPKILWYQKNLPEVYAHTCKVLQSNSYIVYRLTGEFTQDLSQGYGLHCFDMRKGVWDPVMCKELGIDPGLLADLVPCHRVVGTVTAKAASECGLSEGIPVVAGALDAACGTLGAGVIHDGETQEQGGQAGGMSICLDTYRADPRLILSRHATSGQWLLQGGTVGGGGVMRWFEKEFAAYERVKGTESKKSSLELLNKLAEKIPPGSDGVVFLPYMAGERSPIWDPHAKGVFYGLDFSKTKGHFVRAAMEGVALSLRHNIETAEYAGAEARVLRAMGGSANSLLWTQIKADVTGKKVIVPSSDTATTLGAAILAGVGVGEVNRVRDCSYVAGGKGLNVSKTAVIAGAEVLATGFAGGHAGQYILENVRAQGVQADFEQVEGESRSCINIYDEKNHTQTEFLEPGITVTERQQERFCEKFLSLAARCDVVAMSGSVPRGIGTDFYPRLVKIARTAGKPVIVDTSGALLSAVVDAKPDMIKPNIDEIRLLTGKHIETREDLVDAGRALQSRGIDRVVISLGKDGSLMFAGGEVYQAVVPRIEAVNTVGCGDCMTAGFAVGYERGMTPEEALRFASAASAASAMREETGFFVAEDMKALLPQIQIFKL